MGDLSRPDIHPAANRCKEVLPAVYILLIGRTLGPRGLARLNQQVIDLSVQTRGGSLLRGFVELLPVVLLGDAPAQGLGVPGGGLGGQLLAGGDASTDGSGPIAAVLPVGVHRGVVDALEHGTVHRGKGPLGFSG